MVADATWKAAETDGALQGSFVGPKRAACQDLAWPQNPRCKISPPPSKLQGIVC